MMSEPPPDKEGVLVANVLLQEQPLCAACLSAKSGVSTGDVMGALKRLQQTKSVKRDIASRCRWCERWTLVYSLFDG